MENMKILVVGAGIAGLSFARACEQQGSKVTLIDAAEQWHEQSIGICLPANAMIAFKHLGLDQEILQDAHQAQSIECASSRGTTLSIASLKKSPLNKAPFVALPRQRLLEILRRSIKSKVLFDCTIDSIEYAGEKSKVLLSHAIRRKSFDLVVAADGISSPLRKSIFPDSAIEDMGVTNWRFCINMDASLQQSVTYLGNNTGLMLCPISDNQVYVCAQAFDINSDYLEVDAREILTELFSEYCDDVSHVLGCINDDTEITCSRVHSVTEMHFSHNNIVFIGDALHGCPPSLQQGAAMAAEDAITLACMLDKYSVMNAIEAFMILREERAEWVIKHSNPMFDSNSNGSEMLRNTLIRLKGASNVSSWRYLLKQDPFYELDLAKVS